MTAKKVELDVRSAPPSLEPNNTDVFVWALYLLGGDQKQVDVEEIYLKTFEIAPARFGWRTRPDLPNFKKTAKALQEVEAKSHLGLLQSLGANFRRLSQEGVAWVEAYKPILEKNYGVRTHVAAPANSDTSRAVKNLKGNEIWESWLSGTPLSLSMVSVLLRVSRTTPQAIWADRFADLQALASRTNDAEISRFTSEALTLFEQGK